MSDWCCKKHSDIFGPPYFVRFHPDACPYCKIDHITAQLAERDAEIVRLKESEEVLTDCLNGSSKAMYTAEMYDKLRTENAALREDVERLREANHQLASAAICPDHLRPENVRKQAAQECLEILNRCTLHNDMSFAYAQIIHTFGLEG